MGGPEKGEAMLRLTPHSTPTRLVRLGATLTVLTVFFTTAGMAQAGTYPSQHWAYATCGRTSVTNTWTVMSGFYMNRADGFESRTATTVGGGTTTGGAWMSPDPNLSYGSERLYYQV